MSIQDLEDIVFNREEFRQLWGGNHNSTSSTTTTLG